MCSHHSFGFLTKKPGSNPVLLCQAIAKLFHSALLQFTQYMDEYLPIDNGVYCCMSSLQGLIAAGLDAAQRRQDGATLNRSAGE